MLETCLRFSIRLPTRDPLSYVHWTEISPSSTQPVFCNLLDFLNLSGLEPLGIVPACCATSRLSVQISILDADPIIGLVIAASSPPQIPMTSASSTSAWRPKENPLLPSHLRQRRERERVLFNAGPARGWQSHLGAAYRSVCRAGLCKGRAWDREGWSRRYGRDWDDDDDDEFN